jgi:thiol-disulfide isomerase/thioredoxin
MALTKDRSAISTPRILIVATVVLVVARIGVTAFEFLNPPEQQVGIPWQDYLKRAASQPAAISSDSKKPVLYEFYAEWCDPAKRMESTTLCNKQIKDLIEQNFVPIRVTDQVREKGRNPQAIIDLQKKYRIFAFPTLVIADAHGDSVSTLVGSCSSLTTYRFLSRTLNTMPQGKLPTKASAAL